MIVIVQDDFVQLLSFMHEACLSLKLCLILNNNYIKYILQIIEVLLIHINWWY